VSEFTVRFPLPLADADLQKDYALASRFPVGAGDLEENYALASRFPVGAGDLEENYALASRFPVGAGDLSFDPATQSELNSHVGDADAHHSRPTQTDNAGQSKEVNQCDGGGSGTGSVTFDVFGWADRVIVRDASASLSDDAEVIVDGSMVGTFAIDSNASDGIVTFGTTFVRQATVDFQTNADWSAVDVRYVHTADHSHGV
jgi:hypothetical protein